MDHPTNENPTLLILRVQQYSGIPDLAACVYIYICSFGWHFYSKQLVRQGTIEQMREYLNDPAVVEWQYWDLNSWPADQYPVSECLNHRASSVPYEFMTWIVGDINAFISKPCLICYVQILLFFSSYVKT